MEKERTLTETEYQLIKKNYELIISTQLIQKKIKKLESENKEIFIDNLRLINILNKSKV
jgi:hypothetical protein